MTLTATVDEELAGSGTRVAIWDTTTGVPVKVCTAGTQCVSDPVSFTSGPKRYYQAFVTTTDQPTTRTAPTVSSSPVAVSRKAWSVRLSVAPQAVRDGDQVTVTAATNQDLADTGGAYRLRILDADSAVVASCSAGTSCTGTVIAPEVGTVGPFQAVVANTNGGDVQATSNQAVVLESRYQLTLSAQPQGSDANVTATSSLPLEAEHEIRIIDTTASGAVVGSCDVVDQTVCNALLMGGAGHQYVARVVANSTTVATSNAATAVAGSHAVSLTSSSSLLSAGDAVTVSATASILPTGSLRLLIVDNWTSSLVKNCGQVTTCSFTGTAYSTGWNESRTDHTWTAYVATLNAYGNGLGTTIAATSSPAGGLLKPWSLVVEQEHRTFSTTAAPTFRVYETSGQDVALTGGQLKAVVYDETISHTAGVCTTTSATAPCTITESQAPTSSFWQLGSQSGTHRYRAYIAKPGGFIGYSGGVSIDNPPTMIAALTSAMTTVRLPWTINYLRSGSQVTMTTNQVMTPVAGTSYWTAFLVSYNSQGVVVHSRCQTSLSADGSHSCTTAVASPPAAGVAVKAVVGWCSTTVGGCSPQYIQAGSDGFQLPSGVSPAREQTTAGADRCSQPVHADPCQPATGEFYLPATDLSLPARLPVDLSRTYSSERAATAGVFGYGWSSLLDVKLVAPPVTGYGTVTSPIQVQHASGAVWLFDQFYNSTLYPAQPGTNATLRRTSTGWEATQTSDGMVIVFDSAGNLAEISDRFGSRVTVARAAGSITLATDDGRELVATLDTGTGRVTTLVGPSGRTLSYGYDASGNLTSVTNPRGKTYTYAYSTASNLMTSYASPAQVAAGRAVVNTYDSNKRIKTQAIPMNSDAGQTTPQNQTYTFSYSGSYPNLTTTVTEPNATSTVFEYASGRLVRKTVDNGNIKAAFTNVYDEMGNLVLTVDPDGYSASAAFDTAGNQISATDSAGNVSRWTYNRFNQPVAETVSDPEGEHTSTFTYNTLGLRTSMTVPVDATTEATTTFAYGDPDHPTDLTEVVDPDGVTTSSTYNAMGLQTVQTVSAGTQSRSQEWTYNAYGDVLTHTLPRGTCTVTTGTDPCDQDAVETTTYVANSSLPATVTVPANNPGGSPRTTEFGYDDDGRVISVTDPDGDQTTTSYWLNGLPRTVTRPGGGTTTTEYTALGGIAARTTALGGTTSAVMTYSYDGAGRVKTAVSAEGNKTWQPAAWKTARTTSYTYTKAGRITKVSRPDPSGGTIDTTTTYDYAGRPYQVTDPTGVVSTTSYGPDNRVAAVADHDGNQTLYTYDYTGRAIEVVRPSNGTATPTVRTTYSPGGRVLTEAVKTGTSAWATTVSNHTPLGEVDTVTTPGGAVTDYDYSVHGTLVKVTDPEGGQTLTAHNLDGSVASSTDPAGRVTTTTHTPTGNLASVSRPASSTGVETTGYGYDDDGNLTEVIPPRTSAGETTDAWTFTYDLAGRQLTAADPLGNTRSTGYNLDGDVVTEVSAKGTGAANTTTYTRDPIGRITAVGYGDGSPGVSFTYTKASKVASRTDTRGATTFGYDVRGLPASVTRAGAAWAWTYHPDGSVATESRPTGGTETYTYDTAGRIVSAIVTPDGILRYTYDLGSRLASVTAGATVESYGYDDNGALTEIELANQSGTLAASTVTRLADGAPGVVTVTRGGQTETRAYAYDHTGRIAGVCYNPTSTCDPASADEQYDYDRNGNRTSATLAGTTTTWQYNAADMPTSRTTGAATTPITVDPDGNVLDDGTTTYTYRLDGKVRSATTGGVTHTYTLDGAGNRVIDTAGGTTTTLEWHPLDATRLAASTTGSTTQTLRHSPAGPALLTQAGITYSLGRDQVGGITGVVDPLGPLVRASDWTAYGTDRGAVGAPAPSGPVPVLGFQGMPGSGTGDDYNTPARIYDPVSGAFTGQDPEFMSAGPAWNAPSAFANNNPARYTDPTGQNFLDWLASDDGGAPILYALAGIGDALTLGYSSWFRENNPWFDTAGAIDTCSGAYTLARTTADVASIAIGGAGLAKGAARLATRTVGRSGATGITHLTPRLTRRLADDTGTLNPTATTRWSSQAAKAEVTWVDESAAMSPRAADYQAGAFGARSNVLTRAGQAPRLDGVRFDGFDEANGVLIDRKLSVTTFQKSLDQASRQSEALQGSGYTGLWEVPNATQAARAQRIFDQLGITNISVGIVP